MFKTNIKFLSEKEKMFLETARMEWGEFDEKTKLLKIKISTYGNDSLYFLLYLEKGLIYHGAVQHCTLCHTFDPGNSCHFFDNIKDKFLDKLYETNNVRLKLISNGIIRKKV